MSLVSIPEVPLSSGSRKIPVLGLGTGTYPLVESEIIIQAVLEAIKLGLRHFDTATLYQSEGALGEAIAEALRLGLIKSRDELFITSKLWCTDAHADRVIPALQKTLENLKLEYLDLYLIHWPLCFKPGTYRAAKHNLLPLDIKAVWSAMEQCQTLGLAKSIGVSNFSTKKLSDLLAFAKIPPSVNLMSLSLSLSLTHTHTVTLRVCVSLEDMFMNLLKILQVEMNPLWQQKKLLEYCKANGVQVGIFSPLGAVGNSWGTDRVMGNEVLKEIADVKGKSVAQICLRWAYEQGVVVVFKSYNKERLKQNLEIFEWKLSDEETRRISEIPQCRLVLGEAFVSEDGPFKSLDELWDGEL